MIDESDERAAQRAPAGGRELLWRGIAARPVSLAALVLIALFALTVYERRPFFGHLASEGDHWLTAVTVKFLGNWNEEGAWSLRFAMLENPRSIEFESLVAREPYVSYPPGALLGPFVLSLLLPGPPSVPEVMAYNLANHLAVSLVLFALGLAMALRSGFLRWQATCIGLSAGFVVLLNPAAMYWFQNVYFSDQAVILPAALLLLCEVAGAPRRAGGEKAIRFIETAVIAAGVLCDWFMVFLAVGLWLKRSAESGPAVRAWFHEAMWLGMPVLVVGALFLFQVNHLDGWVVLLERFTTRVAANEYGASFTADFNQRFWRNFVLKAVRPPGAVMLALALPSLILLARRGRAVRPLLSLAIWIYGAILGHAYFFKNHSAIHQFSALKFVLPLAIIPFVAVPVAVAAWSGAQGRLRAGISVVALLVASSFALVTHPRHRSYFLPVTDDFERLGGFVGARTGFEDVVFSPTREIPSNPPHWIAFSRKRVYRTPTLSELRAAVAGLPEGARPMLLLEEEPPREWARLVMRAEPIARRGTMRLLAISPESIGESSAVDLTP